MTLRGKINTATVCLSLVLAAVYAALVPGIVERVAQSRLHVQASTVLDAAEATLHYTDARVTPLLAPQTKVQFLPESVSFYAAAQTANLMVANIPGASFRQPTINPTNLADLPETWEADMIHAFIGGGAADGISVERQSQGDWHYALGRPVRVYDDGCLLCHGEPAAAPSSMLDVYGSRNGFGWKRGEIVGAQIVSLPMASTLKAARTDVTTAAAAAAGILAIALIVLNLSVQAIAVRPIRRLAKHADEVSLGDLKSNNLQTMGRDEVASLATSFNRMRRSLITAMNMLDG